MFLSLLLSFSNHCPTPCPHTPPPHTLQGAANAKKRGSQCGKDPKCCYARGHSGKCKSKGSAGGGSTLQGESHRNSKPPNKKGEGAPKNDQPKPKIPKQGK